MTKIVRPGNVSAFALGATGTNRTVFGGIVQSDTLADNLTAEFGVGWEDGVDVSGFPPIQFFNAAQFTATQLTAYLFQQGIAEWHIEQEFNEFALTIGSNGTVYQSLADGNIGNDPVTDGGVNWVQSFAQLNAVQQWTRQQYFQAQTITSVAGSLDWDLDTEQVAVTTLTEDTTLNAPTNMKNGGQYRLLVIQDGTGGWALSFAGTYVPPVSGGTLPEIATGSGEYTLLNFDSDGTLMRVA